jgi:GNAT superfamily N-acetyltransferase
MSYRPARAGDEAFITEMARQASTIEDRPLPEADAPVVLAVLPPSLDAAVIAADETGRRLGAAWWHWHEPPLLLDADGAPLPEMMVAVDQDARGGGLGAGLIEALVSKAAEQSDAVALNVHLRNPAARLYTRTGFRVAGQGRGWFGVAMRRNLRTDDED